MITLKNIGKIYTKEGNVTNALSGINLTFDRGEFVAITGKSGSGKSTLLSVISGLDSYESGEMYIEGKPTSHYSKEELEEYNRSMISFIFQDYNILESFTVLENVEFALTSIRDIKERRARALEIVDRVGLSDRLHSRGSQLSGGEKQRTVIARAIAKDSPIILADEPTGNLDSKTAHDVLSLLKEISAGKLVIVVTHNYDDVREYSTRHIRLHDGMVELDERLDGSVPAVNREEIDIYNFSDAHETIFHVDSRTKGEARCSAHDSFMLGAKRFASRPKQATLISLLMSIALVIVLLVVGFMARPNVAGNNAYAINPIKGRVLVTSDEAFTAGTAEEMRLKAGADRYLMRDKYLDRYVALYRSLEDVRYSFKEDWQYTLDDGVKYSEGSSPNDSSEIGIMMPYSYRGRFAAGDTVYMHTSDSTIRVKIAGIKYYMNNSDKLPRVVVTPTMHSRIARIYDIEASYGIIVAGDDGAEAKYDLQNIVVDTTMDGDVVKLATKSLYSGGDVMVSLDGKDITRLENVGTFDTTTDVEALISASAIDKVPYTLISRQISLFFDDEDVKNAFIKGQQSGAYSALDVQHYAKQKTAYNSENIINRLLSLVVSVIVVVTVGIIMVVSIQKLIYATRGDIAIFRTMGIDSRVVQRSTYVQLFLAVIPAYVVLTMVALVMYLTPLGKSFVFIDAVGALTIFLGSVLLVIVVATSYNRLLYSERIRKNLRRTNK